MHKGKTILGIIPARGGSKGLPGKNIRPLLGKPLIAWTIETALKSAVLDEVMVTTDSEEIAAVAKHFGAKVPFLRPSDLAGDQTSRFEVIKHALQYYKTEQKKSFDLIALLEPTSPLRETEDIDRCVQLLAENPEAMSIVGIAESISGHPAFSVRMNSKGFLEPYEAFGVKRRQDIPPVYFYEGSIYVSDTQYYLAKEFYHEKTLGYVVPKWKSLEVDDIYDFVMVEAVMKHRREMK